MAVLRLGARRREGAWLAKNAWKYGFVMSYPKGKKRGHLLRATSRGTTATSDASSPQRVHASGKTLRQVLWTLQTTPDPTPTATPTATPEPTPTDEPTPTATTPTPTRPSRRRPKPPPP